MGKPRQETLARLPRVRVRREFLVGVTVAGLLVVAGHLIALQRSLDGSSVWFQMSLDARKYLAMTEGQRLHDPLFAPRVLIPFVAAQLPMRADTALRTISYASLFVMYLLTFVILNRLGYRLPTILVSLLCLFASLGHLINYSNPFLTDVFALMVLTAMFYLLLANRTGLFGVVAIVGILGRETCLLGIPALAATKRWWRVVILLGLALLVFVIPDRYSFGGYHAPDLSVLGQWTYWAQLYMAYGFLWWPMGLGLLLGDRRHVKILATEFVVLLAGALLTTWMSWDVIRMVEVLQAVAPALWASYIQQLTRKSRVWGMSFFAVVLANTLWAVPTVFFAQYASGLTELEQWYYRLKWPITIHQAIGFLVGLGSAYVLRRELLARLRETMQNTRGFFLRKPSVLPESFSAGTSLVHTSLAGQAEGQQDIELPEFLQATRHHWPVACWIFVAVFVVSLRVPVLTGSLYEASAILKVGAPIDRVDGDSVANQLKNPILLAGVIDRLGLALTPSTLASHLEVEALGDTLKIRVRTREPDTALVLAKALSMEFMRMSNEPFILLERTQQELQVISAELRWQVEQLQQTLSARSIQKSWFRRRVNSQVLRTLKQDVENRLRYLAALQEASVKVKTELANVPRSIRVVRNVSLRAEVHPLSPWPVLIQRGLAAGLLGLVLSCIVVWFAGCLEPAWRLRAQPS